VADVRAVTTSGEPQPSLGPDERAALAAAGRRRTYRRGDRLFLEGDRGDAVYLVASGRARVYTATREGREVTLCVRGPGELIGEMGALDPGGLRSATVVALDTLTCDVVRAEAFQAFLEQHPAAAIAVLRLVIARLRDADRRRTEFGSYDATRRLARVLADAGATASPPGGAGLALSQQELAGLIGASRESVARGLGRLRERGLIVTGRRTITVRDAAALRRFAG
jgi:CRP-like cAMP-binding protein